MFSAVRVSDFNSVLVDNKCNWLGGHVPRPGLAQAPVATPMIL